MPNLLQKASIVLTPTAYNNGEALCIKPEDGSGDFDFSRNSAATRVNAQGLVENVQILSGNLVQNGSFSEEGVQEVSNGSFSQEGVELITNGNDTSNIVGLADNQNINIQTSFLTIGKTYKIDFEIYDYVEGSIFLLRPNDLGVGSAVSSNGTYTYTVVADASTSLIFRTDGLSTTLKLRNISVREVGQDWTFGTGWSVGEDKAIYDNSASSVLNQSFTWEVGKTYKITFDIGDFTTSQRFDIYSGVSFIKTAVIESDTSYTIYFNGDGGSTFRFRGLTTESFSITNISVKEVGQNWSFTSGATLTDIGAKITHTPTAGSIAQLSVLTIGKQYKLTYEITESISGGLKFNSAVDASMVTTVGVHIKYFEADGTTAVIGRTSATDNDVTITNISVIEITDDTNLPRINYEGFSYQDALGSELLADGNIINSGGGSFTFTPNGLIAISDGTSGSIARPIIVWNTLTIGKQYRIVGTPTINSGNTNYALYDGASYVKNQVAVEAFDITFTCNGGSVFFTNDGTQTFDIDWDLSIKEYLGQEAVPDSGCGHWLWEQQSTNLITYSEDFSQWTILGGGSLVSNSVISPDGTQNASSWTTNALGQKIQKSTSGLVSGNEYTFSVYIKADTNINVGIGGIQSSVVSVAVTTEWQRFEVTQNSNSDTRFPQLQNIGDSGTFYIWGAQLEQQTYATSYIPTSGSTVTRNQDLCTNGGSLASINSTEGVLYAEIAKNSLSNNNQISISLSSGSTNNRVMLFFGANDQRVNCQVRSSGSTWYSSSFDLSAGSTNFNKIAIKYKENDFSFWVNGSKINQATTGVTPTGLNELAFDVGSSANNFFGKTKCLAVWKEALSDEKLTELTTI